MMHRSEIKIRPFEHIPEIRFVHKSSQDNQKSHALHINDNIEIYIQLSGEINYVVEGTYYSIKPGDVVVIKPHEVHAAVLHQTCQSERFYILFPANTFDEFCYNPLSYFLQQRSKSSRLMTLSGEAWKEATELLYRIESLGQQPSERNILLAHCLLIEFLCILQEHDGKSQDELPPERVSNLPALIRDAMLEISKNLTQIHSINALAEKLHVSAPYLSALFKKQTGIPLTVYIRTRKIAVARQLLEDGNSVIYACYESGFNDCSYFIRNFKEHTGMTPLQYRNQFLKTRLSNQE